MKKIIITAISIALAISAGYSQEEMKEIWKAELPHKSYNNGLSEELNLSWAASDKEITVMNTANGSVLWTNTFKMIAAKLNKVDEQIPMYPAKSILLFDRKFGKDQMAVIDILTGKLLWISDKYQGLGEESILYIAELDAFIIADSKTTFFVKARTGEEVWSTKSFSGTAGKYSYDKDEKSILMINYKPTFLGALFKGFKNQILKLNALNGDVIWDTPYYGIVERKVVTRKFVVDYTIQGDKLFLVLNGLQVFDYKTGKPLWSATYDVTLNGIKRPGGAIAHGVYEAIADPLIDGNDVYVFEMKSKGSQYIKKYDLQSGKLIWSSPEVKDARIAPNMYKIGDNIVLQVGGVAEVQSIIKVTNSDGSYYLRYKIAYENVKPYNVQAFKVSDGSKVWESERFKKGITNMFDYEDKILVCSGKAIYTLDGKTGKENYEVALGDDNIGLAYKIVKNGDNVIVIGEKGISSHKKSDGAKIWAVKTKAGDFNGIYGTTAFYETEKDDQFAIDIDKGSFTKFDARKGAETRKTFDGLNLYIFDKKLVTKADTK